MVKIQGQARAVAAIQRAMGSGRLGATWIFAGPAGVGKFTLGVEFAKTVLCDQPRRVRNDSLEVPLEHLAGGFEVRLACGECESCRAIGTGGAEGAGRMNHPDLHVITKELIRMHDRAGKSKGTTMSIHVIRGEITGDPEAGTESKMAKRSFRGRGKFFIIDQADLMEAEAQNSLLKTLEEPPAGSYLILITASPTELLPTIRSRSQVVEFRPLADESIRHALSAAGVEGADAALLARLANGSLGRALAWAEDIRTIAEQNERAADRGGKKAAAGAVAASGSAAADAGEDEEESADKFMAGGILGWTRLLAEKLDGLVSGAAGASDVAAAIAQAAGDYTQLQLRRDRLMSADRAKRDGIQLMMTIAAEWFSDRSRHALGTPHETVLPGRTGALDYALVPALVAAAREAEYWADRNVHDKMILAATTTRWEELLRGAAVG